MADKANRDPVEKAIEALAPALANVSFGAVMGFCSGYALKQVGKALAFVVGIAFIGLQAVRSTGYVDVDWEKVKQDMTKKIDATGDGTLTADDAKLWWQSFKSLMTKNLPGAGGFSFGFLYGVKSG
jgi:FUN14 domain-containing protein 1